MVILHKDNPVGGADMLNSLADVNINNPEDKQILLYDNSTRTWRNYEPSFVDKDNVLNTVEECSASTNPEDVAGASAVSALNSSLTPTTFDNLIFDTSFVSVLSKNMFTIGKKLFVDVFFTSNNNISASTNIANLTGSYAFDVTNKNGGLIQPLADSYGIQYWLTASAINVKTGTPMVAGGLYQLVGVFDLA